MAKPSKPQSQWQVIYQKLYFARMSCQMLEDQTEKSKQLMLLQSAQLSLYASLNAFIDFMLAQTKQSNSVLFTPELLSKWSASYPANSSIDFLANQFTLPYWQKMWGAIQIVLSSKNILQVQPLQEQNSQSIINVIEAKDPIQELVSDIRCWAQMLEDFYDQCAPSLEEY